MKEFLKKHVLLITIIAAVAFLTVFLSFIFHKVGDEVYIVGATGTVQIGTASDVNSLKPAAVGMKLTTNDIVVTSDKSSCVLSYNKNANEKDNFVNISENSQVTIYDKNSQGGYKFFVTYGSVICNMPVNRSYCTNISTKLFNLFADGTITKVAYDMNSESGKVFTFDGNPKIQVIQPSGATSAANKLLKNSVCVVSKMEDGTVGFGCLNVGFGLNALTAQDLKTMSGVANAWAEKIAYGTDELEQAFQTAADYAKWAVTEPVVVTLPETEMVVNSDTYYETTEYPEESQTVVPNNFTEAETNVTPETTVNTKPTAATQTVPEQFRDDDYIYDSDNQSRNTGVSLPITVFTRPTIIDLENDDYTTETVVPDSNREETVTSKTERPRETEAYTKDTTANTTTAKPATTTKPNGNTTTATKPSTAAPVTTKPSTSKPPVMTVPVKPVDTNQVFTVIFAYDENSTEYWSVQLVKYGKSAIAPDNPVVPGKTFIGWDRSFSNVTSNITVMARFADTSSVKVSNATHTVNLYVDSQLWKTITVKDGGSVVLSEKPVFADKSLIFCGWSESLTNIKSDVTAFAMFKSK